LSKRPLAIAIFTVFIVVNLTTKHTKNDKHKGDRDLSVFFV